MPLFQKIIDGIARHDIVVTDQIAFGLFGDGLVDPLVVQRARYVRETLPDVRLSVNTNGAAFNMEKHGELQDLAFTIALHCESLVPEVYDDLMRPLRAERVFPKFDLNPKPIACGPDIMDDLIVDCDGKVLSCCQDFQRLVEIGDMQAESFETVLTGVRRESMRKLLAEKRHGELETCSRCFADLRGDYVVA